MRLGLYDVLYNSTEILSIHNFIYIWINKNMRFFVVVELQEINLADREKLKSQFLKYERQIISATAW